MSMMAVLKNRVESLPAWVGRPLANVPFGLRLGPEYIRAQRAVMRAECSTCAAATAGTLQLLQSLIRFAVDHVEFYREFYRNKGFSPGEIQTLADWQRVPVVTKADLQDVPLAARTARSGWQTHAAARIHALDGPENVAKNRLARVGKRARQALDQSQLHGSGLRHRCR